MAEFCRTMWVRNDAMQHLGFPFLLWFENHTMQAPADHSEVHTSRVRRAIFRVAKPAPRSLRNACGCALYCEPSPTRISASRPLRISQFPDRYQCQ